MKNLESLLQLSNAKNLRDIMVSNQSGLRFQKGNEWFAPDEDKWIYLEVKNLIFSLLTDEQRKELTSRGGVSGVNLLKTGERIKFVAFESKDFIQLQMRVFAGKVATCTELGINETVEKWVNKPKGLILVSGVARSGRSTTWAALMQKALIEKNSHGFIGLEDDLFDFKSGRSTFVKFKSNQELRRANFAMHGAQIVAIDETFSKNNIAEIVHHLAEGKLVIATASGHSVAAALQDMSLAVEPNERARTLSILGDNLIGAVNQTIVAGMNEAELLLSEVVVGSPQIRLAIGQGQFQEIEKIVKESAEKYGMMTINQALLQSIVRRRIDLKLAFIVSPDPENLEELMKKVGI